MFIIKAIKTVFFWLIIIAWYISIGVSGCISSCKSCLHDKLSDNLFNKTVLSYYDIPWLKKPENATEKDYYQDEDKLKHVYRVYLQEEQDFWDYGEYIYDTFLYKNYTIGRYEHESDIVLLPDKHWVVVKQPTIFEDCWKKEISSAIGGIQIYYSEKGLVSKYTANHGYELKKARSITLLLTEEKDGLLLTITCCSESNRNIYMQKEND